MLINKESVISSLSYREKECLTAALDRLVEVLSYIKYNSKKDMGILDSWREHFKQLNIPFIVVKYEERLFILKLKDDL